MTNQTYNLMTAIIGAVLMMMALIVLVPNGLLAYLFMLVAGAVIITISIRNTLRGK